MIQKTTLIKAIKAIPYTESEQQDDPLTCEINRGSLTCIQGQKADCLNRYMEMLAGINQPNAGDINYSDELIQTGHNFAISYLYHNSALVSILNGVSNIKAPALYHQFSSNEAIDRQAEILLAELETDDNHKLLPAFMNALQKKQLLIIRAIMLQPKVLFIERPFMDLDREQVRILGKYLAKIVREKNISLITSNVNADFVNRYADQLIYIRSTAIDVVKHRDEFTAFFQNT